MWDPSFPTRNLAHTPWTGRKSQSLNHQESPDVIFYTSVSFVSCYQSLSVNPAKENSGMECCTGVRMAPFCSQLSPSSVRDPGQDPPWPWHLACTPVRGGSGTSWLQQHISVPPSCGYRSSDSEGDQVAAAVCDFPRALPTWARPPCCLRFAVKPVV